MSSSTNFGLIIHFEFTFIRDFQLFQGYTCLESVQLLGPLGDSISVASLHLTNDHSVNCSCYLTQTLFKAFHLSKQKGITSFISLDFINDLCEHHCKHISSFKEQNHYTIDIHARHALYTWALFKTHCIFKRNGDFGVENNAFCNISLLTLPYIQEYCTFHDYIITADGTSL